MILQVLALLVSQPSTMQVLIAECEGAPLGRFLRHLKVELAEHAITFQPSLAEARLELALSDCRSPAEASLRLEHQGTKRTYQTCVELRDVPASQWPQVLALSAAELISRRWARLSIPLKPAVDEQARGQSRHCVRGAINSSARVFWLRSRRPIGCARDLKRVPLG